MTTPTRHATLHLIEFGWVVVDADRADAVIRDLEDGERIVEKEPSRVEGCVRLTVRREA